MRRRIALGLCVVLGLGGLGCASHRSAARYPESGPAKSRGHGPPPHAPAHGYRAKVRNGVEITYRSDLGVYVVVGAADTYFLDDVFYKRGKKQWESSRELDGPWELIAESSLPPGLRSKGKSGKRH